MTFDTRRQTVLMHGGMRTFVFDDAVNTVIMHDQWEWDGVEWRVPGLTFGPAAKGHSLVYDQVRDRAMVFSGSTANSYRTETHEFDRIGWERLFRISAATPRNNSRMVFDEARLQVLMTGGYPNSDTWVYRTPFPGRHLPYGTGCAGVAGVPELTDERPPYIGDNYRIHVSNLPPVPSSVFVTISSASQPAPVDLTVLGMPGCRLYGVVDGGVSLLGNSVNETWIASYVPDAPALAGFTVHLQAFVVDPAANVLGLSSSNAVAMTIGIR